jgi:hypothetical protein
VSGCIDNIQAVTIPFTTGRSGLDGNTTLLFLLHEVSGCFTIVYLTGLVDLAGQFQNTFRGGGLAGIHVCEDSDIPVLA